MSRVTPLREPDRRDPDLIRSRLDYSQAVAYPLSIVRMMAKMSTGVVERLLLGPAGVPAAALLVAEEPDPGASFEAWLLARSLVYIRSEAFRESVEYEMLMAEWERSR